MATVESWYWDFIPKLKDRVRRGDWPSADAEYWEAMYRGLARVGCNAAVADEASQLMAESPPEFLGQVVPAFLAYVKQVFKASESAGRASSEAGTRDAARMEARTFNHQSGRWEDCDDCQGEGLATRFRKQSAKPGVSPVAVFYCRCALGRWLENAHRTGDDAAKEVHRRIPDLADFPQLWGAEYCQRTPFVLPPGASENPDAALVGAFGRKMLARVEPTPNRAMGPDGQIHTILGDKAPWLEATGTDGPAF